jgi:hypothetical protein
MSSISLDDMDEVRNGIWETEGYDSAEHRLTIDASVGMGSLKLIRRK